MSAAPMIFLRILATAWQLPVALPVWLAYLLPAWALGWLRPNGWAAPGIVRFALLYSGGGWHWDAWVGWSGLALPCAIIVRSADEQLERHELRHCLQWSLLGPLFPVVYGLLLIMYGYEQHPLERDARRHAEVVR